MNRSTRTASIRFSEGATHWFLWGLAGSFQFNHSLFLLGHLTNMQPIFSYRNYCRQLVFMSAPLSMIVCCRNSAAIPGSQQQLACAMMAVQWLLFLVSPWVLGQLFCSYCSASSIFLRSCSFGFQVCTSSFWCCSFPRSVWQCFFRWLLFSMNSPLQLFCLSACYCSSAKLKFSSSVSFHWIVSLLTIDWLVEGFNVWIIVI